MRMTPNKTIPLALGLLATSFLGLNQSLNAADIEEINSPDSIQLTDIIIQIDEIQLSPEQQATLSQLDINVIPPSPGANDSQPQPVTLKDLKWKMTHSSFNVLSDLISLTSSILFLSTQFSSNPHLFPTSAAMASVHGTIDLFRGFTPQLAEIKKNPGSLRSVTAIVGGIGQTAFIVGLDLLAAGVRPDIGAWLAVSGGLLKFGAFSALLGAFGIDKTFGDSHTVTNSIFRIAFSSVGGSVGGLILASGISANSENLITIGIYTLAITGIVGTLEGLTRDIQEVHSLGKQLQ